MLGLTRRPQTDPAAADSEWETPAYMRRQSLVSAPRERALEWTASRPTKPGFYAQKPFGTQQPCSIVEVIEGPDGSLWWAWGPREPAVRVDDDRTFGRFEWGTAAYQVPK